MSTTTDRYSTLLEQSCKKPGSCLAELNAKQLMHHEGAIRPVAAMNLAKDTLAQLDLFDLRISNGYCKGVLEDPLDLLGGVIPEDLYVQGMPIDLKPHCQVCAAGALYLTSLDRSRNLVVAPFRPRRVVDNNRDIRKKHPADVVQGRSLAFSVFYEDMPRLFETFGAYQLCLIESCFENLARVSAMHAMMPSMYEAGIPFESETLRINTLAVCEKERCRMRDTYGLMTPKVQLRTVLENFIKNSGCVIF